jgi:hypothetical protein
MSALEFAFRFLQFGSELAAKYIFSDGQAIPSHNVSLFRVLAIVRRLLRFDQEVRAVALLMNCVNPSVLRHHLRLSLGSK